MNRRKYILSLVSILLVTLLLVSGSTFAYFVWVSSDDTFINIAVSEKINMTISPPAITKTGMYPTNNCASDAAMSGVSVITIDNQTGVKARPNFKLKVKITDSAGNVITNDVSYMDATDNDSSTNKPYMYYIKYAVTEENGDCTLPLYSGRFDTTTETFENSVEGSEKFGWYDSDFITMTNNGGFPVISTKTNGGVSFDAYGYELTSHRYKVWFWVDQEYITMNTGSVVGDLLQNATINVSWSNNSFVEQVYNVEELEGTAYAVYSEDDTSLRFYRSETPITVGSTYNGLTVTAVYTGFETSSFSSIDDQPWRNYRNNITNVVFEDVIRPVSTAYWFSYFRNTNIEKIDVTKLDTRNVISMVSMFSFSEYLHNIIGLEYWDTSKVTNMSGMFSFLARYNNDKFVINIGNWVISNVTNLSGMFWCNGQNALVWSIGDISRWDTSNVTNMGSMFYNAAERASIFDVGNLGYWDVSKVTQMQYMFRSTSALGYGSFNIGDISRWDTSNVENMSYMFNSTGENSNTVNVGDISGWNVCKVTSHENFNVYVTDKIATPNFGMACPS